MPPPRLTLVEPGTPPEDSSSIVDQLQRIADDIRSGRIGDARSAVVIVKGVGLMVYGIEAGDPLMRLNAAHMLLSLALRELEAIAAAT